MGSTTCKRVAFLAILVGAALAFGFALAGKRNPHLARDREPPTAILRRADAQREGDAHSVQMRLHNTSAGEPRPLEHHAVSAARLEALAGTSEDEFELAVRWIHVVGSVLAGGEAMSGARVQVVAGDSPRHDFSCGALHPRDEALPPRADRLAEVVGVRANTTADQAGHFGLRVEARGQLWLVVKGTNDLMAEPIALRASDGAQQSFVIRLAELSVVVRGQVAGAGAGVFVHMPGGPSTYTDARGRFELPKSRPGSSAVHACSNSARLDAMPRVRRAASPRDNQSLLLTHESINTLVLDAAFLRPDGSLGGDRSRSGHFSQYRGPSDAGSPSTSNGRTIAPPTNPAGCAGVSRERRERR